jgi:UDP-hydrolysing UDP-N-acetyl-D-glucosamine 2-epimerase
MLGISLKKPIYLMTYHPVTLEDFNSTQELQNLLNVVFDLKGTLIITGTNIDPGSEDIKSTYKEFLNKEHKDLDVHFFNNLGFRNYLSLMLISDIVIGNSSSGIIEAPAMGVSTVDIGDRQKGRPRAASILHTDKNKKNIKKTIKIALSKEHQVKSMNQDLPYGGGDVAKNIVDVIIKLSLNDAIKKTFYDV